MAKFTPKRINTHWSRLELNTDNILREIDLVEFERRKDAAKHAVKVMKGNISKKGISTPGDYPGKRTGFLRRKTGYKLDQSDRSAMVGSKSPHVHLLEFGHGDGKERNKRPFVYSSLLEAEPEIIRIMSREYF